MNTQQRRASHAKRRWQANPNIYMKVIGRSSGFSQEEQTECALPVRLAWTAMRNGRASAYDAQALADVIAICIIASETMDALVQETCEAARAAMGATAKRFHRIGKWGVDAQALRDIPPVLDLYEELLRTATGGQFERWMALVKQQNDELAQGVAS